MGQAPTRIQAILSNSTETLWGELNARGLPIWHRWSEIVGREISRHARPYKLQNRVLLVRVDHPVWTQELQYLKEEIKAKLNAVLGENRLENLFFLPGNVDQPDAEPPSEARRALTPDEAARIDEILPAIADPEIRAEMRRLAERFVRSQRPSPSKILATSSEYRPFER
jgi:hypothetical protein